MDKQEARQTEMDERYKEGIAWRNTVRDEDKKWRERLRREDKEWREMIREEDKAWREALRDEDKAWRVQLRGEDLAHRMRSERTAKWCCALTAAAQTAKSGSSPEKIFALARHYEGWLNSQAD
jgi:hypothetical protein